MANFFIATHPLRTTDSVDVHYSFVQYVNIYNMQMSKYLFIHCISAFHLSLESPRFRFMKPENYTTVYHQQETDVLYVGGQGVIYKLSFSDKGVHDKQVGRMTP